MLSFFFSLKNKRKKSQAFSQADNALSTGILIMHGKEKPTQLSAPPLFMELLTSILCVSLQFNLTRTTSPALIRCISKEMLLEHTEEVMERRRRQIERMSLRKKSEMHWQRQGENTWKGDRQMERKSESQTEAMTETDTETSIILTAGDSTLSTHFKRIKNYSVFSHSARAREQTAVSWSTIQHVRVCLKSSTPPYLKLSELN